MQKFFDAMGRLFGQGGRSGGESEPDGDIPDIDFELSPNEAAELEAIAAESAHIERMKTDLWNRLSQADRDLVVDHRTRLRIWRHFYRISQSALDSRPYGSSEDQRHQQVASEMEIQYALVFVNGRPGTLFEWQPLSDRVQSSSWVVAHFLYNRSLMRMQFTDYARMGRSQEDFDRLRAPEQLLLLYVLEDLAVDFQDPRSSDYLIR